LAIYSGIQYNDVVSNVRYAFDELTIPRFRRHYIEPKKIRPNSAIDTETANGRAFLVADSDGNFLYPEHWTDIIEWLYENERHKRINWLYNLDYDVRAMLAWLPKESLFELWTEGKMIINNTSIEYLPSKHFSLKEGKYRVNFYDLAQFFNTSLDTASNRWLGEGKHDIDSARIDYDKEYRENNKTKIREYCIQDARLTDRLADIAVDLFAQVGVKTNKWYSTAYLSEKYFLKHTSFPVFHNKEAQRYAWYSYAGGRFEVFERGYIPQVYKYDIHSAYPHAMKALPDLDSGEWRFLQRYDASADLAFLKVKMKNNDGYIQPLHYKIGQLVTYPQANRHVRIITKPELDLVLEYDLAEVEILNGWHFYNLEGRHPFELIDTLYEWRQELKRDADPREWVIKILMNSIYGKTIQVNPRRRITDPLKTGNLFIPAYASEITAQTRVTLLRECLEQDLTPLAFFTDAILLEDKANLPTGGLGAWAIEASGEAVLLGSGVYSIRDGEHLDTKLRGFRGSKSYDLFGLLEANADSQRIPITSRRPVTLGEFVYRISTMTDYTLNMWLERDKSININFDHKRAWNRSFVNGRDVLTHRIESLPLTIR